MIHSEIGTELLSARVVFLNSSDCLETCFPGCAAKIVAAHESANHIIALLQLAPKAMLPSPEHFKLRKAYMLEGRIVHREQSWELLEADAGHFLWRRGGRENDAWCPDGGLMIGVYEILPNHDGPQEGCREALFKLWNRFWFET